MKRIIFLFTLFFSTTSFANIYTNNSNFRPYIGINGGVNIANYTMQLDLDSDFISATINAGAKIGHNFGIELFFSHSSSNSLDIADQYPSIAYELYFQNFGFDIYGYYGITSDIDFFTTFGVANYKLKHQIDYIYSLQETEESKTRNNISTRIGIGLMYTFPGDKISMLAQYKYIPISLEPVNNLSEFSIGMRYTF